MIEHELPSGRALLICTPEEVTSGKVVFLRRPYAMLLVAQSPGEALNESLLDCLLNLGAEAFVCCGAGARHLEDEIDRIIEARALLDSNYRMASTSSVGGSPEEVVDTFLNTSGSSEGVAWCAVLRDDHELDSSLREVLARRVVG